MSDHDPVTSMSEWHRARMHHDGLALTTDRLVIRDWSVDDAEAALHVYGAPEVTRWLMPAMRPVPDADRMRTILRAWRDAQPALAPPRGRWAVQRRFDGQVIGGLAIRPLPASTGDLQLAWQLNPRQWGQGYATEAARALINWAFAYDIPQLSAVARPANVRSIATAERLGMRWTDTVNYDGLQMRLYRIRRDDLPEWRRNDPLTATPSVPQHAPGHGSSPDTAALELPRTPFNASVKLGRMG
ncbi:MAG TPA: GNAT family N-acetyltransferase [Pseudonocardia sp.]